MAKLKAGEWFESEGEPSLLISTRPDYEGDIQVPYTSEYNPGKFCNNWKDPAALNELPRLYRIRWVKFRSAKRSDDNNFHALYSPNGRKALIIAGCRSFTIAEAKAHWADHSRAWLTNPAYTDSFDPALNQRLNAWSLAYVSKLEAHLKLVRAGKAV